MKFYYWDLPVRIELIMWSISLANTIIIEYTTYGFFFIVFFSFVRASYTREIVSSSPIKNEYVTVQSYEVTDNVL